LFEYATWFSPRRSRLAGQTPGFQGLCMAQQ
jgi:hypothetical protein